jgi:arylsulfatase A-like enzyme
MNVAVVVLDTLRKDAFERHFDWLPGQRFDNAWAPSHWTVPVHGSLFTGLYPSETGVYARQPSLRCERPVLAEQLAEAGYTTRAFSCNPYVSPVFDYDRGFEEFTGSWRLKQLDPTLFDWNTFISETQGEGPTRYLKALSRCLREDCRTIPSLRHGAQMKLRGWDRFGGIDDDGAAAALEYVQNATFGSEEFLYVNLMEAHTPYDPPEEYNTVDATHGLSLEAMLFEEDTAIDAEAVRQAYDDCVRYLSDVYEDIFAVLADQFDYVITLSDHGELLGEHGGWMHGYGLYSELTNVPLCVHGPETETETADELVSLLDIHATVLDLTTGDDSPRGRSVLGESHTDSCLTEYHGFTAQKIEKFRQMAIPERRLNRYDQPFRGLARQNYYGFETPDGFVERGEDDGQELLQAFVDDLDTSERRDDEELSDDVLTHLEDLGYA